MFCALCEIKRAILGVIFENEDSYDKRVIRSMNSDYEWVGSVDVFKGGIWTVRLINRRLSIFALMIK